MKNILKVVKINNQLVGINWGNYECFTNDFIIDFENNTWLSDLNGQEVNCEEMIKWGFI